MKHKKIKVPLIDRTQLSDRGNSFPFFDPATKSFDCNVSKVSEAIELFNGTQLTAKDVRTTANTLAGPTGNVLARRNFLAQGMMPGTDFFTASGQAFDTLNNALYAGWYVGGYIDYGVATDVGLPIGAKYDGIHAIGIWGWRKSDAGIMVWDHDPLFDGRRITIPFGRQHVSLGLIQQAMAAYAGTGKWSGWAVKIPLTEAIDA